MIQQNEVRKAQRLATLMRELGLEGEEGPVSIPALPPLLSSFSPINTLQRPNFPPTPPNSNPTSPNSEESKNEIMQNLQKPSEASTQSKTETEINTNGNNKILQSDQTSRESDKTFPESVSVNENNQQTSETISVNGQYLTNSGSTISKDSNSTISKDKVNEDSKSINKEDRESTSPENLDGGAA